ncbi:aspartate dehydrogenase [Nitratireductor pacificus]|uniref:aspartate dehydrogenase n=1 Tax=Nitratireductor pacificus TaxID=1231180 RepID=UPI001FCB1374|nr:aspartate dehydrogenase [Nitratireductor pacificus]
MALIGWGAISRRVVALLSERMRRDIVIVAVAVRDIEAPRDGLPEGALLITRPEELGNIDCDIVIEAAGRCSIESWGTVALTEGCDFVISSTSAFRDDALRDRLTALAEERDCQIIVPPGAIGGIDALAAAAVLPLDSVEHLIVKPPAAWRGTPAEASIDLDAIDKVTTFFSGSARQAADLFPQNANVAAISAMAGVGFERTRVTMVADPYATRNGHRIVASGAFGKLDVTIENEPLATNPKSSELTALSLIRLLENRVSPLVR